MSNDDVILHQDDVESVVADVQHDNMLTELAAASDNAAIANVAVPSATYVEAEAVAAVAAINAILAVLRESQIIPT